LITITDVKVNGSTWKCIAFTSIGIAIYLDAELYADLKKFFKKEPSLYFETELIEQNFLFRCKWHCIELLVTQKQLKELKEMINDPS